MIRGTTPTHIFNIPFDVSLISNLRISYAQGDKEILSKKMEDATLNGQTISVTLTQEDTFKLDCKKVLQIQLRVLTTDGEALSSNIINITIGRCLNEEVLA